jgi:hypothetical protein
VLIQAKTHKWHFKLEARFQTIMKSTQIFPFKGIQLILELIWSLIGFNRLCDPKATWRKVLSSLWSSMVRILIIGRTELATIS